jgi:hypothetical protein
MIQTLQTRFKQLDLEYPALLEELHNTPALSAYCDQDIFRIEPFYVEKNNLNIDQFKLVDNPDELNGSQIFQVLMHQGKILFHREWMGENCYYDGFFIYAENQKTRLHFYIKGEMIKPISLEIVHFDKQGHYQQFYCIDIYSIYECSYRYNQNKIQANYVFYNAALKAQNKAEYQIKRSPHNNQVLTIDAIESGNTQRIYDASYKAFTLEQLLTKAHKALSDDIITACSAKKLSRKKIHCLLLEYTSQGPFPPTLALIQEKEVKACTKNKEHPLGFLNAPDAGIFLSEMETEHGSLYEQINRHIDTMSDIEYAQEENNSEAVNSNETPRISQKIIIDFYTKLSKSLKLKIRQQNHLQLSIEFYVCARDFEACNELDYLQAVLPQKQFSKIQQAIEAYEQEQERTIANNPAQQEYNQIFQRANEQIAALIEYANVQPADYWYHDEFLYFIEPFGFEMKTGRLNEGWQRLLSRTIPASSFYFRYQMQGDTPISIAQISEEKLVRQWYWKHTADDILQIEWYCFKNPSHIESCELIKFEDGLTSSHTSYSSIIDRHDYQYDESQRIISCQWQREFTQHPSATQASFTIFYDYHQNKITKIYRKPGKWDDDEHFVFISRIKILMI